MNNGFIFTKNVNDLCNLCFSGVLKMKIKRLFFKLKRFIFNNSFLNRRKKRLTFSIIE